MVAGRCRGGEMERLYRAWCKAVERSVHGCRTTCARALHGACRALAPGRGVLNAFLIEAGIAVNISLTVVSLLRRGKLAVFL